jgi:DNA polymerase elongation subunit (family B)
MYVDVLYNRAKDVVQVVERVNGERVFKEYRTPHTFYYSHPSGGSRSIFGDAVKKFTTTDSRKFQRELAQVRSNPKTKIFESDIRPAFRVLEQEYKNSETPKLNVCFVDIETGWDPVKLFAPPSDPFNEITAITIYLSSHESLITLALCPPSLTLDEATKIGNQFENTLIFAQEEDMLKAYLQLIEDVDMFSGWNSESFDIPYLVNRIRIVLGDDYNRQHCLWRQRPRAREYLRFGKLETTYDFPGRPHLDYMQLYKKHVTQQQHSYKLDFIGQVEVGESKVPYDGSLDDLYKNNFHTFLEYSRQDVMLLVKIDKKKKYIDLHNQVAHANCVDFKTTMGSVSLVETAIILEMHEMGLVVPDKKEPVEEVISNNGEYGDTFNDDDDGELTFSVDEHNPVVGAYVAKPKVGLHEFIGAIDINSLYPSVLRALNMSPETIVGQVRLTETENYIREKAKTLPKAKRAEAWEGVFHCFEYGHMMAKDAAPLTIDYEDGREDQLCGWQLHDMIYREGSNLCITANGTIFRTDREGIIPALLARWYSDRKKMQGLSKACFAIYYGDARPQGFKLDDDLLEIAGDYIQKDGDWYKYTTNSGKLEVLALAELYDQRQLARKILLNSLYGALLNVSLRFFDARIGQSVTLTGRAIAKHMNSKVNEVITDVYDYAGDAIIYADTDSCYFSIAYLLKTTPEKFKDFDPTKENYITLYDGIADIVNESFAEFMNRSFNTGMTRGGIIKAGRELVASRGLFIKKKKYAVLIYDLEGKRLDVDGSPGKLKAMGLDLKRADTPKIMQDFMSRILTDLLVGASKEDIFSQVTEFRKEFKLLKPWEKGSPKAVNNLTEYYDRVQRSLKRNIVDKRRITDESKVNLPQQVRASINWNEMCEQYNDNYAARLTDGSRTVICRLMTNAHRINSIAYPFDEHYLPKWFKELPFDEDRMEEIIIDKKLKNLLGVLGWNFAETKTQLGIEEFNFF